MTKTLPHQHGKLIKPEVAHKQSQTHTHTHIYIHTYIYIYKIQIQIHIHRDRDAHVLPAAPPPPSQGPAPTYPIPKSGFHWFSLYPTRSKLQLVTTHRTRQFEDSSLNEQDSNSQGPAVSRPTLKPPNKQLSRGFLLQDHLSP